MYERFTDRARKVMQLANQEAQRFNHEYIGTEHILLGIAGEDSSGAANVLKNLGVDLREIRTAVEKLLRSGPDVINIGKLPQTPRAKQVIAYAIEESRNLEHDYLGTEHILLGLLREQEGVASQVLMNFGLRMEKVREEVGKVLAQLLVGGRKEFSPSSVERSDAVEIPAACPKCGNPHIVRVLWHCAFVWQQDIQDLKAGKAILGSIWSYSEIQGPSWVCLRCSPRWSEVHELAMQDWEWQVAKQEAVASADFSVAAQYRDDQESLRHRLRTLVSELAKRSMT
jgi:hypothetical protein